LVGDNRLRHEQEVARRAGHLLEVHHTSCFGSQVGPPDPDPRRGQLYQGQVIVRGNLVTRGKGKRADYVLSHKANLPLDLIEANDNTVSVWAGMQQALEYAEALGTPFVFSSKHVNVADMRNALEPVIDFGILPV
jgi:hypothetical protein